MVDILRNAALPFVGSVILLIATILHILSFAAPYWATDSTSEQDFGLWRQAGCRINTYTECYRYNWTKHSAWFFAVRALECLTIIFWSLPLVIIPVYIYIALGLKYRCLMGTMAAFTLIGALCNIIGAIIFGVEIAVNPEWRLGWCLIVCLVGGGIGIVASIVYLLACCNRPQMSVLDHYPSGFYVDPDRNKLYVITENWDKLDVLSEKSNPNLVVVPH